MVKEQDVTKIMSEYQNNNHKKTIEKYNQVRKLIDKVGYSVQYADLHALLYLSRFLKNKEYKDATQTDMMKFDEWFAKQVSTGTYSLYIQKIRRFYKYLSNPRDYKKGNGFQKNIPYPDNVIWMQSKNKEADELPIDEILTLDEILKLLKACTTKREQTLICILTDYGLRNSELRSLKIKSIGFDVKLGAYVILPKKAKGLKTGMRKIHSLVIDVTTAYIKEYLNTHPNREKPDAYLFQSISNKNRRTRNEYTPMTSYGIWRIVERIVKNSRIKKEIHPHTLRHVSATYCALKGMNESMLRERFGWAKGSTMPSRYVHLAQKDTRDFIMKLKGIVEEKDDIEKLQPVICPNCEYENVPTNIVCGRCGMKLNIKAEDIGVDATTTGIATQEMLKDPQFREFYNEMLLATWEKYKEMKQKP